MAESAIGADFDETLDVHRNFLAQIAFHQPFLLDDSADPVDFFLAQVLNLLHGLDLRLIEDAARARLPNSVDVGQRDINVLLAGQIHACDTCHKSPKLSTVATLQLLAASSWPS